MRQSFFGQVLHIMRKDLLHVWIEVVASIVLLGVFAWNAPTQWLGADPDMLRGVLAGLMRTLIVIAWLVIIARVVHEESLVGDRQFWVTRPYTWQRLLTSKLLFIFVFLMVPLALTQMYLLHHAGVYLLPSLWPMAKNIALVFVGVVLPVLALSAITTTFPRLMLSLIGFYLFLLIAEIVYMKYLGSKQLMVLAEAYVIGGLAIAMFAAVVIYQYSTRNTLTARLMMACVPLIMVLVEICFPTSLYMSQRYKPFTAQDEMQVTATEPHVLPGGDVFHSNGMVAVMVPVTAPRGVSMEALRVKLEGSGGAKYESPWENGGLAGFAGGTSRFLSFRIPDETYGRLHNQPVKLHVDLALTTSTQTDPYTVTVTKTNFPVPDHGACALTTSEIPRYICHYPYHAPEAAQLQATVSAGPCDAGGERYPALGWMDYSGIPIAVLDPVMSAWPRFDTRMDGPPPSLCEGAALTVRSSFEAKHGLTEVTADGLNLDQYMARTKPKTPRPAMQQRDE